MHVHAHTHTHTHTSTLSHTHTVREAFKGKGGRNNANIVLQIKEICK